MQPLTGFLPVIAVDQVVPIGHQISEWTALMAERHAAIHTTRGLCLQALLGEGKKNFLPVLYALLHGSRARILPLANLHKSGGLAHRKILRASSHAAPQFERLATLLRCFASSRAFLNSIGMTSMKRERCACHCSSISAASGLPVKRACFLSNPLN